LAALSFLATAASSQEIETDEMDGYTLIEDGQGNPLFAADSEGRELTFVYDAEGRAIATIDGNGVVHDMTRADFGEETQP
jgi:YD repeat-containing protein